MAIGSNPKPKTPKQAETVKDWENQGKEKAASESFAAALGGRFASILATETGTAELKKEEVPPGKFLTFDSRFGDICDRCVISLRTSHMSQAKIYIEDPNDEFREDIEKGEDVKIKVGFVGGYENDYFVGKVLKVGRKFPNLTALTAIDESVALKNQSKPGVVNANTGQPNKEIAGQTKVVSKFEGEAIVGDVPASGDEKKTIAHRDLKADTLVRITNTKNSKSVLAKVAASIPGGKPEAKAEEKLKETVEVKPEAKPEDKTKPLDPLKGDVPKEIIVVLSEEAGKAVEFKKEDGKLKITAEVLEEITPEKKGEVKSEDKSVKPKSDEKKEEVKTESGKDAIKVEEKPEEPKKDEPKKEGQREPTVLDKLAQMTAEASKVASGDQKKQSMAEAYVAQNSDLRFSNQSSVKLSGMGTAQIEGSLKENAQIQAALQGDILVMDMETNQLKQIGAGQEESSGVILDWNEDRSVFVRPPVIDKKTRFYQHLISLGGAASISGFNATAKEPVGATVVTPGGSTATATGTITVPKFGDIKMEDYIFPGCPYKWGRALSGGSGLMTPENDDVIGNIIKIAQIITKYTKETGAEWEITSWYRDTAHNASVGGKPNSRHLYGDAVDFYFPAMQEFHDKLYDSYDGGLAISPGSFVHLDTGSNRRWNYN